jgi:hypothetical protein
MEQNYWFVMVYIGKSKIGEILKCKKISMLWLDKMSMYENQYFSFLLAIAN